MIRIAMLVAAATLCGCGKERSALARVRVLSYNIHHGAGVDERLDVERIARIIRDAKPDLVAIQEVDSRTSRVKGMDQPAELASRTGLRAAFGRALEFGGGEYGNLMLSRQPISRVTTHVLPNPEQTEVRSLIEARIDMPGEVRFFATHLSHNSNADRLAAVQRINERLMSDPKRPTIIAGDFNARPDDGVLAALTKRWRNTSVGRELPTFPAGKPDRQIDFVLVYPAHRWRVESVMVLDEPTASDHRPILVELVLLADHPRKN